MGQLGLGEDMVERKKPHPVGGALEGCIITQVICGGMHTVALSKEGKVRGNCYSLVDEIMKVSQSVRCQDFRGLIVHVPQVVCVSLVASLPRPNP